MIVNSKNLLIKAQKNMIAIPQFNINNLEWTKYILEECDRLKSPVILGVTEKSAIYMGGFKTVANIIKNLDEELNIKVPVVIHLDHGKTLEVCKKAIDSGFTSVMIDASYMNLNENKKITKSVVDCAEKYTVSVEAELGSIELDDSLYTNVEDAIEFVKYTNIDSLAPAIGTVHGLYQTKPNLRIDICKRIKENVNIPLVLHGGSGIDNEQLKETIKAGICKININTELQVAWSNAVKKFIQDNIQCYDPRLLISSGEKEIKRVVKEKIEVLNSNK